LAVARASLLDLRLGPDLLDKRVARVVQGLREREFLKGTVFERGALEAGIDPYSLLLGILLGIAVTLVLGLVTVEIWMPRAISRLTGRALAESRKAVMEILRG
jgi:hypothetical protein